MAESRAVIKNADMSEDMQQDAVDCASQALKYNTRRILRPILRRNLIRSTTLRGIASLGELWFICDARDKAFHIFLFGTGSDSAVQERLDALSTATPLCIAVSFKDSCIQTITLS